MDKELRILIIEDNPADAKLEEYALRKAGFAFTSRIVDTEETFRKAIDGFFPDIILSDYDLPTFDGLAALRIAKEKCPDVPFIIVSGKLGEEFAIEKLKEGAIDYVLKNNLKRLVPVINRALQETKEITERKRAEKALKDSEERFRKVFEEGPLGMVIANPTEGKFLRANDLFCQLLGYTEEELKHLTFLDVTHPEHRRADMEAIKKLREGKIPKYVTEKRYLKKNGEILWGE
jgi:PAS domain S-box-containing protein